MDKIPVGISACLLGQQVRYDGGHKHFRYATEVLSRYFDFRPLCPELGAGLGVPRPAIHLRQGEREVRLVDVRGEGDHTEAMRRWIADTLPELAQLRGFVLKAKSPSCGMERVRIYKSDGGMPDVNGRGLFAEALLRAYPLLPVEEEGRLNDDGLRENFIERVFAYDDWMRLREQGITPAALIAFHTRHKYQLLAHCQKTYRQVGPLVANLKAAPIEVIAEQYGALFMRAMAKRISRGAHVNAMQHILGFLRASLGETERELLCEQIDAYFRGEVPLVVPMTLLRMAQRREPVRYLQDQCYLAPYPDRIGLRNRV